MVKRIGIITQARLGSSRLPGKILKMVSGKSLLQHHVERLNQTSLPLYIATTNAPLDDAVESAAHALKVKAYRGSEEHVLSRFIAVASTENLEVVIRVTSDCPLIDPELIRQGVDRYLSFNDERIYLSNTMVRTYARGFDFEIFSMKLLREALEKDPGQASTEHVTPYLYSGKDPTIIRVPFTQSEDHSFLRVTVDEPSDYDLIKILILNYRADELGAPAIEKILIEHPELVAINAAVEQKKI